MTVDPASGKIFWARVGTDLGLDIETYDKDTLKLLSSMTITRTALNRDDGIGRPARVTRLGSDALVVVTEYGQLIYLQGDSLK